MGTDQTNRYRRTFYEIRVAGGRGHMKKFFHSDSISVNLSLTVYLFPVLHDCSYVTVN